MRRWEEVFTEADRKLVQKAAMAQKQTFGKKPALLIIDVTVGFLGSTPKPVLQSAEEYATSCGEVGWVALTSIQKLLEVCRANGIPIIFTTGDSTIRRLCRISTVKIWKPEHADSQADKIPEAIAPLSSELVIHKTKASAFFGTPLAICLQAMKIDSLLIAGTTTSGCVRASVVDACSYGYSCFIVEECVFDRFDLSHLVSLFDMNAKYADVISIEEAIGHVSKVRR